MNAGVHYYHFEQVKCASTCRCGERMETGHKRLHVSGKNNFNPNNICMKCVVRIIAYLRRNRNLDETMTINAGLRYYRFERVKRISKCRCGECMKKGDVRLHVSGKNNMNAGNICIKCVDGLLAHLQEKAIQ